MGSRALKVALVAAALLMVACAPLPQPLEPFRVNTTADTFDGVCDETDCSIRDAIHASNVRSPHPNGLPNEIRIPAGTYELTSAAPLTVTQPVVINGVGRLHTILDLTDSATSAPGGVFHARATTALTGVRVISSTEQPTHVLASCDHSRTFSLIDSATENLVAVTSTCDSVFLGADVSGAASVIEPYAVAGTGSRLPFPEETIHPRRVSFANSVVTGPTTAEGATADSVLTIHPPEGGDITVTATGSHFDRVGLSLGDPDGGDVFMGVNSSSFDLAGETGPRTLEVQPGSSLRLTQSSVFGGGPDGAVLSNGVLVLEGATLVNDGPAVVVGPESAPRMVRSILSTLGDGVVCTAPITSRGYNVVLGDSCGEPDERDVTVATHAEVGLSEVGSWASLNPTLGMLPDLTSPAIDLVPIEGQSGANCPFLAAQNSGLTIDQRGFGRPSGSGCDAGAVERIQRPQGDPGQPVVIEP